MVEAKAIWPDKRADAFFFLTDRDGQMCGRAAGPSPRFGEVNARPSNSPVQVRCGFDERPTAAKAEPRRQRFTSPKHGARNRQFSPAKKRVSGSPRRGKGWRVRSVADSSAVERPLLRADADHELERS